MVSYHSDVRPDFLRLEQLPPKPRQVGLTHALDKGISVEAMVGILTSYREFIDIWKFGWGTSYAEPRLADKMALLKAHGVQACIGGTLLEIAWAHQRVEECLDWAQSVGFEAVEVSRGIVPMTLDEKQAIIRRAATEFTVFAETGYKSQDRLLLPEEWRQEILEDMASGARYVVAEGRESGTIGVYNSEGETHIDVVDAAVESAGIERVIFEAPRKDQQVWFIERHGPTVNLGNIGVFDLLALVTLRLGLRADTVQLSTPDTAPART
jgi:phosphosulfolactate synthase